MWTLLRRVGDFIAPPLCPVCDRQVLGETALCPSCWRRVGWIARPFCERMGTPFPFDMGEGALSPAAISNPPIWTRARAAARYDATSRRLIHALKYRDRPELARLLGTIMARAGRDVLADADLIIPAPMHPWRLLQRRFNQAALIARTISDRSGRPLALDALRRRSAARQVGLGRAARHRNMAAAFSVPPERREVVAGRTILFVDDVLTTGATAAGAARTLLAAGAAQVDVLVFARTVRSGS